MLGFPETRNTNLRTPTPSPERGVSLPPDEHLLCYDYLYYVSAFRVRQDYAPGTFIRSNTRCPTAI